jgi:thymidylate kinase
MFFLDICPEEAYRRVLQTCDKQEMFEGLEESKRIRRKALFLALISKWRVIDADKSQEDVERGIRSSLRNRCQ